MSFDIVHRSTGIVLYRSETATTVAQCVKEAYLAWANLAGADLEGAYLEGAYLEGAYLEGAYLEGADLAGANLRGANLRGADLAGANLEGANLRGADLAGAYLEGANLGNLRVLQIAGSQHWTVALLSPDGCEVRIGCKNHPLPWWLDHYRNVGEAEGYTPAQIDEYGRHLAYAQEWAKYALEVKG